MWVNPMLNDEKAITMWRNSLTEGLQDVSQNTSGTIEIGSGGVEGQLTHSDNPRLLP